MSTPTPTPYRPAGVPVPTAPGRVQHVDAGAEPGRGQAPLTLHLLGLHTVADLRWDTGVLNPAERARVGSYPDPVRRARACASRLLVRAALGRTLGCQPAEVPLAVTDAGRPVLASEAAFVVAGGPVSRFSVSHDHGLLVVADHPGGCGVDVEDTEPALLHEVAARFCTPDELAAGLDAPRARILFTAKESVVKAYGLGLPAGLATVTFGGDPARGWVSTRRYGRATGLLTRVNRYGGHHLAVTVRADRPPAAVTVTRWQAVPGPAGCRLVPVRADRPSRPAVGSRRGPVGAGGRPPCAADTHSRSVS